MRIVVCPDSFKGSLSAKRAAEMMTAACQQVNKEAEVFQKAMADGGEGTVEALVFATNGHYVHKDITGPLGEKIRASYGVHGNEPKAFIEVGNTAGLVQVPEEKRNPYETTSYGLGEMLRHVIDDGFQEVIVGLGGSATNDGGLGMLTALGVTFRDAQGKPVGMYGKDVLHVAEVDVSGIDPRLEQMTIQVASDVDNPLCGELGASAVFGPQKGATPSQVKELDQALDNYGTLLEKQFGRPLKTIEGAGAAGGLGVAFLAIGATLVSGASLVGETIQLEEAIQNSDLVMTGEGKSDVQTLYGKAPSYVASLAKKHKKPVLLLSGAIDDPEFRLNEVFSAVSSIMNKPMALHEAMAQAETLLYEQTVRVLTSCLSSYNNESL